MWMTMTPFLLVRLIGSAGGIVKLVDDPPLPGGPCLEEDIAETTQARRWHHQQVPSVEQC